MWQGDIFPFRLGGRYAYLIGFIDDYSRYTGSQAKDGEDVESGSPDPYPDEKSGKPMIHIDSEIRFNALVRGLEYLKKSVKIDFVSVPKSSSASFSLKHGSGSFRL